MSRFETLMGTVALSTSLLAGCCYKAYPGEKRPNTEVAHVSTFRMGSGSAMDPTLGILTFGHALTHLPHPTHYIRSIDGMPIPSASQEGCSTVLPGRHTAEVEIMQPPFAFEGFKSLGVHHAFFTAEAGHRYEFRLQKEKDDNYLWLYDETDRETVWGRKPLD
jgi:hypothetical protein